MLIQLIYFIWALLPLCLGLVALKAAFKKFSDTHRQESVKYFLIQMAICSAALALTIWLDKALLHDMLVTFCGGESEATIVMFLEYPAVLLILARLQKHFYDDRTPQAALERKRMHRAVWSGQ